MNLTLRHPISRRRAALCAGVSATALIASGALTPALADAASVLSPAALAQATAQRAAAVSAGAATNPAIASPALQAQVALSAANLQRAAQAIAQQTAAQAAARASSQLRLNNAPLSGSSWNGTPLSGLNPVDDADPTLWINADALQKDTATATASVKQTSTNAILSWQSFDLDAGEVLVFDQQGHSDWTVLNRIVAGPPDASGSRFVASPSHILGKIEADGAVYVINPNGIIFGPTAQVNVHSLIASSLDVGNHVMTLAERNGFFLNTGILGNGSVPPESFSYNQRDTVVEGEVRVEAGAVIETSLASRFISPDAGGFVYLLAPKVQNDGTIVTPAGETLMVAAQAVQLIANSYPDGGVEPPENVRGVGVNTTGIGVGNFPFRVWRTDGPASGQISEPGSVINNGLIDAERGVVILNGDNVTLGSSGIIRANTSLTRNGRVFLDASLKLTMHGMVQILPVENDETIPLSAVANFEPGSVEMQGRTIDLEPGSLIIAPGASVDARLPSASRLYPAEVTVPELQNRIYMAPGSVIDVSGLTGVTLPMSANLLTVKPFGNEFADQPLQRQGPLRGQDLTIDIRDSGTFNGLPWIGTPLGNFSGFAGNVPRTVSQLLTTGGKVSLTIGNAGDVVLREGSTINVGGGYVQYEGGVVNTTKLLTADGRVVDIARASPLDTYVGIAGTSTFEHARWGPTVSETFADPLILQGQFEPGYIEGRDAGGITLDAERYVLEATFYAGAIPGENQRILGLRPAEETANTIASNPYALPSAGYLTVAGLNNLIVQNSIAPLAGDFTVDTLLPEDRVANTLLDASLLTDASFGRISASFSGQLRVEENAVLVVVPGGTISLVGGSADIAGQLIARSGSITIESTAHVAGDANPVQTTYQPEGPNNPHLFNLTIGSAARLDASGLWVNDTSASPQDVIGGAFIDGGSIELLTHARSAPCTAEACTALPGLGATVEALVDLTGNIVLSSGSRIDVSSGGRIGTLGLVQTESSGRIAGNGGSLTLQTYAGGIDPSAPGRLPPTIEPLSSSVVFSGSDGSAAGSADAFHRVVSAYGFAQGGTLSIQAPSFQLGGPDSMAPGALNVPIDFFDGNAFSKYDLRSIADGITVASGTTLTLRQRNFSADESLAALPTGAKIADVVGTAYLPDILRTPVDLSLSATLAPLPDTPYDDTIPTPPMKVALSVEEGAVIQGDPEASISITVNGHKVFTPDASNLATFRSPIARQTAVAAILGTIGAPGGNISLSAGAQSRVWLGENSRLDASGAIVVDTRNPAFQPGTVLPGGTVTISGADPSTEILAAKGSVIDVSGTAGEVDVLTDPRGLPSPHFMWSDAGSITLRAATLLFDGSFDANPGASQARGGSLTISVPKPTTIGTEQITVRAEGKVLSKDFQPTDDVGDLIGSVIFQADHLKGSGIADLTLSASAVQGDDTSQGVGDFSPGTITFKGDVKLGGLDNLFLDASRLSLVDVDLDAEGCHVCLSARYVALRGSAVSTIFMPVKGPGRLRVEGDTIDIAAGSSGEPGFVSLTGIASARFISNGDIRLRVPLSKVGIELDPSVLPAGELITAGNLTFQAQQIYPVSNVDITLKSIAPNGTIAFVDGGTAPSLPLSAGGRLTVSAATIRQGGTLRAPLGTIRLGAHIKAGLSGRDPTPDVLVPTQAVTLEPGSITSVSLSGKTVPFGETANGISWSYDNFTGLPLGGPPAKVVVLAGQTTIVADGATLDATGGGDIQAMEFVPGLGGTRDVLALPDTYAIIPGYNPAAAPLDLAFVLQKGDSVPAAGLNVYLTGGPGLSPGYYTLLPAHYATLPGAYRVSLVTDSQNASAAQNAVLSDGTMRMSGFFARPAGGTRNSADQYFDVQSSSVWRQYSEILQVSGTQFFGATTGANSDLPPRLPVDAGHIVFNAAGIHLDGMLKLAPAAGGRGADVDLAAEIVKVVSGPGSAGALSAKKLSNLGAESLLLGGVRNERTGTISVIASSVEIENDETAPLQAPEIILVADGVEGNAIRLRAGSVVSAIGSLPDAGPQTVTIGDETKNISGNGSLLAVSNGATLNVVRENVDVASGLIVLEGTDAASGEPAAAINGKSLTLDSAGGIRLNSGAGLQAENISIAARNIHLGDVTGTPGGLVASPELLAQLEKATTLTLRSATQAINFYGNVDLALSQAGSRFVLDAPMLSAQAPGAVTLSASKVEIINSGDMAPVLEAGGATLQVDAASIALGTGDKGLSGFAAASFNGSSEIAVRNEGSFDAGGAGLSFQTPVFLVGTGTRQTITTTGIAMFSSSGASTPSGTAQIGGALEINAGSMSVNSLIEATAGGLTLHATAGDIVLGANAKILANGFAQEFFDVTRVAYGGTVQLTADHGSIDADAASSIDVSSPLAYPGYAGTVALRAPNGNLLSNGGAFNIAVLSGSAATGDSGGRLILDAQTLGTTSLGVPSIFTDTVDVRIRQGDLQLMENMTAAIVTLTADKGALTIAHTIDASGTKGGTISLYGGTRVVLTTDGKLLATASSADKSGGEIIIGTSVGSANGSGADGIIDLQAGVIDVSNTAVAANGGTVRLRAPLIGAEDVSINPVATEIRGARSVTVEAFKVFDTGTSDFNGIIDPVAQPEFYGSCSVQSGSVICSGTLVEFVRNFSLSSTAQQKFTSIPAAQLHLQPGIELVNNDPNVNNGDITVANAWNLGSGFAGFLTNADQFTATIDGVTTVIEPGTVITDQYGVLLPQYANYKWNLVFVAGVSAITSLNYRVGGSPTGEPGTLTLRAMHDVDVNASITDGFFSTRNVFDPTPGRFTGLTYQEDFAYNWASTIGYFTSSSNTSGAVSAVGGYLMAGADLSLPPPPVPYDLAGNDISPVFSPENPTPVTGADLFPLVIDDDGPIVGFDGNYRAIESWSYRIVGGSDTASANPLAVRPLAEVTGHGDVAIDGHQEFKVIDPFAFIPVVYRSPTIIRTGTGSIDIAAARDFKLLDHDAPGVVYTAGRNSTDLPDPGFVLETIENPRNPNQSILISVASNPTGFLAPQVLSCILDSACDPFGPFTQAAYPVGGGHLTLSVQRDIRGFEHPVIDAGLGPDLLKHQYFTPWLLAQGSALSVTDFGVFSPLSGYLATGLPVTPSQTSWWINFGSFGQGLMSVGGDVRIEAGRDIRELSVSLPTTARFSGGLSSTITDANGNTVANIPVAHINGSGDLRVIAGRDLKSGAYYEGSGEARISVGGTVSASWARNEQPVSTVLALDTGTISLHARGAIDIAGVVSGPSLQNVADPFSDNTARSQSVSTYGPASGVSVQSAAGKVIANSLENSAILVARPPDDTSGYPGVNRYPADFEAVAFRGNVEIADFLRLTASENGSLDLLAYDSLLAFSPHSIDPQLQLPSISTGPSLVEAVFDPLSPLSGFAPSPGSATSDLGALLLHDDDDALNHFYAATGSIVAGAGPSAVDAAVEFPMSLEISKPARVRAGEDIVDLSFFGQNLAPTDVTSVVAGRDLYYTGAWQEALEGLGQRTANGAGLSLAGPGVFRVEAGRNLGPFVTAAADIVASKSALERDSTGTGIITFGNTLVVGNRRMSGNNEVLLEPDPFAFSANENLPRQGADIVVQFGTANGVDYQAVIDAYINPATSTSARDYMPALQNYLHTLGKAPTSADDAWTMFQSLSAELQNIFVGRVFFSELRVPGDAEGPSYKDYDIGYSMISTLFPASLGYTDNSANPADRIVTGSLDLLHATIKTLQSGTAMVQDANGRPVETAVGGDIMVLGPGGDINVGTTAPELKLALSMEDVTYRNNSAVGVLTLDNGVINTFTDGSVLVNQSRILTVQGGDIVMWSSNKDLDAGRGAKTTVDFRPLSVLFAPNNLQTLNLNGLVSGAGIGTIQSTPDAPPASAFLIAPRGIVNAGDAGLRSSGNISIAALLVLNAANISTVGTVAGVPEIQAVNLGALESTAAVAGQAAQAAEEAVAAATNRAAQTPPPMVPSLITVEVFIGCDPDAGMTCTQQ